MGHVATGATLGLSLLAAYLAAVNLAAFVVMGRDKARAVRQDRRIPERLLLTLAAVGGAFGATAGQQIFRHKTRKQPFARRLLTLLLLQAGLGGVALYRLG